MKDTMEKIKKVARLAVVAILTTGVFAGVSGPANAESKRGFGQQEKPSVTVSRFADTGWG